MIQYSFIIPHHNAPNLLERCINSIPVRNDIQIIVIDDNSEESLRPKNIRKDVEIIYIDQHNTRGAGHARNEGIKKAVGKWLLFVDCDDFLTDNAISALDKFRDSPSDIVFFKISAVDSDTLKPSNRCLTFNDYIDAHQKRTPLSEGTLRYIQCVPWGKMIRRNLIIDHDIQFEEIRYGNDVIFSLRCGVYAKKIESTNDVLYVVTDREGSLITQVSFESVLCRYKVSMRRSKILVDHKKLFFLGNIVPDKKIIKQNFGAERLDEFYSYAAKCGFNSVSLLVYSVLGMFGSLLRYLFRKI